VDKKVIALAELIWEAERVLVLTGAGISTASGIPDFRGPNGVWNTQRPVMYDQFINDERRRRVYWEQKLAAAEYFDAARPNPVHHACVDLERAGKVEAIVTQNVDGLHTDAGTSPDKLVEVHGTAREATEATCLSCRERTPIGPHMEAFAATATIPVCHCEGLLKPATISFGQPLDPTSMFRAHAAAEACDLVVALGSTLAVYPVADVPWIAVQRGTPYAIVNQGRTEHDGWTELTLRIDGDVTTVFPEAVRIALDR
jgi:NAD-dependent deacetylase